MIKGGDNDSTHKQVFQQGTAEEAKRILETVVSSGTGTHADIGAEGQWGKTGTTEENGDAWFCGGIGDEVDRLRLGRLPGHDDADDDPLQGRPGDGRHLPGADLGQRDDRLGGDQGRTAPRKRRRTRPKGRTAAPTAAKKKATNTNRTNRPTEEVLPEEAAAAVPKWRRKAKTPPKKRRSKKRREARAEAAPEAAAAAVDRRRSAASATPAAPARAGRRTAMPAAQKRQGRSTAFVIPIRGPVTTAGGSPSGAEQEEGSRRGRRRSAARVMPSASVSLPGPLQRSRSAWRGPAAGAHRARARRSAPAPGSGPRRPRPRVRRRS